jgi:hypothetical protein
MKAPMNMTTKILRAVFAGWSKVIAAVVARAHAMVEAFMPWGSEDQAGFRACAESEIMAQNVAAVNSVRELALGPIQTRVQTLEMLASKLESKPAVEMPAVERRENRIEAPGMWTAEGADAAMKRAGAALEMAVEKLGIQGVDESEQCQLFFPLASSPSLRH